MLGCRTKKIRLTSCSLTSISQLFLYVFIGFLLVSFSQLSYAVSSIQITIDGVDAPIGRLKQAILQVDLKYKHPKLKLKAAVKPINETAFIPFNLKCGTLLNNTVGFIDCFDGELTSIPITALFSAHLESYRHNFSVDLLLNDASFSDKTGAYAGEGLIGDFQLSAQKKNKLWHWNGKVNWTKGEVFWTPFYFGEAGNAFEINGTFEQPMLNIASSSLLVNQVGKMNAVAKINTQTKQLEDIKVNARNVDFEGLYTLLLKPKLEGSAFADLEVDGQANWQFEVKDLQPTSFELTLSNANIIDNNGKFSFNRIDAHIPWDYDDPKQVALSYQNGYLLNLPLGKTQLVAELNRYALTASELVLPMLDGALHFQDVSAAWLGKNWVWHLRMDLIPISLNQFSTALGWPLMEGKVSGKIPLVTYANKQLNMDGAMTFNAFDGIIGMNDLRIDDPLGVVPRLYADLSMRQLDLGEVTRTFSFGAIEGKLDGKVNDLVLENWKAVYFDASLKTSKEKHKKKISQRAVENIAALGGAGTAAALQRSFLRFFDEFNYDKIGFTCKLRRDVCEMGGVEPTPTGYIIVKGKGIPAVNINGYTKHVSLQDLLNRIKRITDSNSKVIVK